MANDTREKILRCGGEIIHLKGFSATGLQEILAAAQVPKGSFYFYFQSKEDFGLALIDYYRQQLAEQVAPILNNRMLSPLQRLDEFFQSFRNQFAREGFIRGCPLGNLVQELGDVHPAFREKLFVSLEALIVKIARLLTEARELKEIPATVSPEDTARFIVSAWQGALLRMKACAGPEPLDNFHHMVFTVLLA